jgi:DNA-binding MarR family transcriptional regulator
MNGSRVANRLAIGKPTVSVAADALAQRGLLLRSGVDGDQRVAALIPAENTILIWLHR